MLPSPAKEMNTILVKETLQILSGHKTRKTTPYVYALKDIKTQRYYIGSRCAEGCHPNELGVSYFTTSKIVKPIYKEHPDRFSKTIVYIGEDAVEIEHLLLETLDAKNREEFYNLQNGKGNFNGKKAAILTVISKIGVHARTKEQMRSDANKMVSIHKSAKTGIFAPGVAEKGRKTQEKLGLAAYSKEARSKGGKTSGDRAKLLKTGIHALTSEQRSEIGKKMHATKYKCAECDMTGPATSIALHQKAKRHIGKIKLENKNG